jgi:hypothetical protein
MYKMYFQAMEDVRNVLKLWPNLLSIANDCRVSKGAVEQWIKRNAIPAKHSMSLVNSSKRLGIDGISLEFLSRFHKAPN